MLTIVSGLLLSITSMAQTRYTINGYVSDSESGERLIGATVYDTISHRGVVTNQAGFYTLSLPAAEAGLQVSYVGYHPTDVRKIVLHGDTLINITIRSNTRLDEVTIVGNQSISGPESAQMSAVEVPIEQLKAIPMIGGEVDILKAIQLLPGVQSGAEGSAGVYVRGGGPDENLILLDGVPLYNVNHLMGFFSVFNADAVKNVTLYKGNFPAQYGGRLSSIIDVRQNDGNAQAYHGNLSVGLLSAKFNVEGPIPHKHDSTGRTTFNVSARRTYFDAFVAPLAALISAATSAGEMAIAPGAYFYDVNAKLSHTFADENNKLSASFYMGDDVIYANISDQYKDHETMEKQQMNFRMGWGNLLGAINWESRITPRLFSNTQLSYTRYRYKVDEGLSMTTKEMGGTSFKFDQSMGFSSSMRDLMLQSNFDWSPLHNNTLRFGAEYTYHQFRPEVSNFYLFSSLDKEQMRVDTTLTDGTMHGHEAAIYVEDQWSPWHWLKLNIGARASLYSIEGKVYPSIEPRAGLRALLYKDLSFKASYSYTTQYIHLLSSSGMSLPTDLWVPITKDIPPMRSMIVAAGLSYNLLNQCELSVEGYYKKSLNLVEYKDGASFFSSATSWQDKVALGEGWSYGVEFLAQRKVGPVTGWIGYTWSRTMRQFDHPGQMINYGKPFHAKYDREHDLSITLQYAINKVVDISGTFVYGTGTRATLAKQIYYDPSELGGQVDYIEERNNYKMPDYHRLDLGVNFHFPHKYSLWGQTDHTRRQWRKYWADPEDHEQFMEKYNSGRWTWLKDAEHLLNISVYNVYCHANPFMMLPDSYTNSLRQISIFPILPSISYTFKF